MAAVFSDLEGLRLGHIEEPAGRRGLRDGQHPTAARRSPHRRRDRDPRRGRASRSAPEWFPCGPAGRHWACRTCRAGSGCASPGHRSSSFRPSLAGGLELVVLSSAALRSLPRFPREAPSRARSGMAAGRSRKSQAVPGCDPTPAAAIGSRRAGTRRLRSARVTSRSPGSRSARGPD